MNQQYLFNVKYFENLAEGTVSKDYEKINRQLTEAKYTQSEEEVELCSQSLVFVVKYPGILVGTGYDHEAGAISGSSNSEIKTGFSLDYVTGLPYIPGSTVKGVLRSAFQKHSAYIAELLSCDERTVENLELAFFEYGKDVFLDAFPVKADPDGKLLGNEYITPHKASDPRYDGLTGINPIHMLKVRPGVIVLFRFILQDSVVELGGQQYLIKAQTKLALFEKILEEYGIGSKTNTGVGRLQAAGSESVYHWLVQAGRSENLNAGVRNTASSRRGEERTGYRPSAGRTASDSEVLGVCPICHQNIIVGRYGTPVHNRDCGFRFRKYYGTELTNEQIRKLLAGEEISVYDDRAGREITVRAKGTESFTDRNGNQLYRFRFR